MKTIEDIKEIDDLGQYKLVNLEKNTISFISVEYDQCAENPLEGCDAMGNIYSFSTRHGNFLHPDEVLQQFDVFVTLGYYEHGLCQWAVSGEQHSCPWDSVNVAGIWVPDKYLLEELETVPEAEKQGKLEEWARQACKVYTDWCNGQCYYYNVEEFDLVRDEYKDAITSHDYYLNNQVPTGQDSCGGFYGEIEYAVEMLQENF